MGKKRAYPPIIKLVSYARSGLVEKQKWRKGSKKGGKISPGQLVDEFYFIMCATLTAAIRASPGGGRLLSYSHIYDFEPPYHREYLENA